MKNSITSIVLLIFLPVTCTWISGLAQGGAAPFSNITVKKRTGNMICDTCQVKFALNAEPQFSYVISGSGSTPPRFYPLKNNLARRPEGSYNTSVHLVTEEIIGLSFLPNFITERGRRIQLYRNFGGEDYTDLEFSSKQNGTTTRPWSVLSALKNDSDYVILGTKEAFGEDVAWPWKRSYFAGRFDLNINDSLNITVRNIHTKKIVQVIWIIRPPDKATHFIYYQLPLTGPELSASIQHILNAGSGKPDIFSGDSSKIFDKDYGSIGFLRFNGMTENEALEYTFDKDRAVWNTVQAKGSEPAAYIVLGNDLAAGEEQNIYLRYSSQPETINKIIIRVKARPFQMPWLPISITSTLLLIAGWVIFYLWNRRNRQRLDALRHRSMDTEMRLSLLSGQLNPHFLFNSLNAIQGTMNEGNTEKATSYLSNVAGFMRSVMNNSKKEFVSLKEELKIEEDYLRLEQQRTSFTYNISVLSGLSPELIEFPPMLLQPVLENSIRHAFGQDRIDATITINISAYENTLIAEVGDNGRDGWDVGGIQEGHGLSLTRKRIAVYNEKLGAMPIHMEVKSIPGTGTITTFTFQNWLT